MATQQTDALKAALDAALPQISDLLKAQASAAIAELAAGSEAASEAGLRCLTAMQEVAGQLARGEVTADAADLVLMEYTDALLTIGQAVAEKAKAEAYDRGLALLDATSRVLLGIAEVGLKVGVGSLAGLAVL